MHERVAGIAWSRVVREEEIGHQRIADFHILIYRLDQVRLVTLLSLFFKKTYHSFPTIAIPTIPASPIGLRCICLLLFFPYAYELEKSITCLLYNFPPFQAYHSETPYF